MEDEKAYELLIGIIIVLIAFNYLYSGTAFYSSLIIFIALVGVIFFIRGVIEWFFGRGTHSMLVGAAICFTLMVLFNGFSVVLNVFNILVATIMGILTTLI